MSTLVRGGFVAVVSADHQRLCLADPGREADVEHRVRALCGNVGTVLSDLGALWGDAYAEALGVRAAHCGLCARVAASWELSGAGA